MRLTLGEIRKHVEEEGDAYVLLERLRWPNGPICAHCGNDKAYFLKPANGKSRATGPKRTMSQRRVWKCAACRKQFSVLTNTIFHGTKIPIETWLMVMVQMTSAKNGISSREVERMHDLTPETAWYMLHRLREAMKRDPLASLLSGTVIADETFIGGSVENMHKNKIKPMRIAPGGRRQAENKVPVLSLVHKETGEVRSAVVPNVTGHTLRKVIAEQVDMAQTTLHTDSAGAYKTFAAELAGHESVNHVAGEYVRGDISTNRVEGFFSQLKRSIDGTHHHVSRTHLHRYVGEFDFRYSTCKMRDPERLQAMVDGTAGRRLTYEPLKKDRQQSQGSE
jgi:transposase-like protein